jgi:flagellar motor switch protein FliN
MPPPKPPAGDAGAAAALSKLPAYTRSLLRVEVPVQVVLAESKQSIDSIVRLGPGSIIQFEKSCEEMLDVEVAGHRIAQGEVVKVGDKFGIRVTSILLPEERFRPLRAG